MISGMCGDIPAIFPKFGDVSPVMNPLLCPSIASAGPDICAKYPLNHSAFLFRRSALSFRCSAAVEETRMADKDAPLLIKRYASRRLYNTETSDYVTLDDIARFIRAGREVQIIDLKSGDDLTRQYLLQIIADNESQGESVLPINVLTDLVRSYTSGVQSVVPQFLSMSFDMLREGQTKIMGGLPKPLTSMPGFDAMKAQQAAFIKAMTGGWAAAGVAANEQPAEADDDLDAIKRQLAELQTKLSKMGK